MQEDDWMIKILDRHSICSTTGSSTLKLEGRSSTTTVRIPVLWNRKEHAKKCTKTRIAHCDKCLLTSSKIILKDIHLIN
jgi:hypothetical protein